MSYEDSDFGTAMDYYNDFNAIYGYYPPYQAAESTASVQVFVDAMERARSFDTEAIRDALAATDLMTFYGPIKFTEAGNNMAKPMVLRQIINGKLVAVAPSRFASEPVVYPRPDM